MHNAIIFYYSYADLKYKDLVILVLNVLIFFTGLIVNFVVFRGVKQRITYYELLIEIFEQKFYNKPVLSRKKSNYLRHLIQGLTWSILLIDITYCLYFFGFFTFDKVFHRPIIYIIEIHGVLSVVADYFTDVELFGQIVFHFYDLTLNVAVLDPNNFRIYLRYIKQVYRSMIHVLKILLKYEAYLFLIGVVGTTLSQIIFGTIFFLGYHFGIDYVFSYELITVSAAVYLVQISGVTFVVKIERIPKKVSISVQLI